MAQLLFPDSPGVGDVYAGDNGVNYTYTLVNGLYVWLAAPATPLSVSNAGVISGTAASGSVLTYTQGSATGGTSPYTYTWQWKKASDDSLLQTGLTTYTIPSTLIGDRVYVTLTATDASSATATGDTTDYPASPSTISAATFPNSSFTPAGAPNASPASVSTGTLHGTATCASWADGATSLTSTGGIWFSVAGGAYGTGSTAVNPGNSVSVIWNPATVAAAADGVTLTGTLTNGTYTNTYTLVVDRAPDASSFLFTDLDPEPQSTAKTSNTVTPAGFTVPITLTVAGTATNPLTAIGASVGGATFSSASQTVNPGQTVQLRGTTGAAVTTTYGMTATLGAGPSISDTWTVKTSSAAATVAQPSVLTPANNAVGQGTASGLTLTSGTYTASGGAGAQANSEWEIYTGGYPLGPSTNTISVVTPGTAGTAGTVQWKTSATGDTNPNSQNEVYGKLATDQFTGATYPAFNWAKGLNIGGFTDWYIPAKNELEILYFNLKPAATINSGASGINPNAVPARASYYTAGSPAQTTNALFQSGGSEAFSTTNSYWSATEVSSNTIGAWRQIFASGAQNLGNKDADLPARAVRRIPIAEYTAAGSPAIGTYLKGGFYGGQISTAGNGIADYALIVAPNSSGTYGYTGGSNASLTIAGANTDGFQVGFTIKGNTSNATGVILSINATTITYLPASGTFVTGETISTNPASYSQISGSPFTVTTAPLTSLTVAKPPLAANTTYYARVRYTSQATVVTSNWSGWQKFTTGSLTFSTLTQVGTDSRVIATLAKEGSVYFASGGITGYRTSNDLTNWTNAGSLATNSLNGITPTSAGLVAVGATSGAIPQIYLSTNGGTSWTTPVASASNLITSVWTNPYDRQEASTSGSAGYTTANGGTSWTAVAALNAPSGRPFAWQGASNVFAMAATSLIKSSDNGLTWASIAANMPSPLNSLSCVVASNGSRVVSAARGNYNLPVSKTIAYSDDGGTTWSTVTGPATASAAADIVFLYCYQGTFILMENISVYTVVNFYFSSDGVTWSSGTQITAAALSCGQINIGGCIDPNSSGGVIGISTSTPAGGVYYQLS